MLFVLFGLVVLMSWGVQYRFLRLVLPPVQGVVAVHVHGLGYISYYIRVLPV